MSKTLTQISGVGPGTAKLLAEHGLTSLSEISSASIERLSAVPGFSSLRAGRVIKAAKELLSAPAKVAVKAPKATPKPRRTARKSTPKAPIGTASADTVKPEAAKEAKEKEKAKLKKATAKKAKKAAAKKAKAEKAAAKKKAKKAAAKKAKKKAKKKAAAKKAKKK
ncbi:MAG: hypothetical protein ACI9W4_000943 [Rhodothermales bacterium]|jgi:hypothetical protein